MIELSFDSFQAEAIRREVKELDYVDGDWVLNDFRTVGLDLLCPVTVFYSLKDTLELAEELRLVEPTERSGLSDLHKKLWQAMDERRLTA